MKISDKLSILRTEKDMTQSQIAKIAGVSDKSVSAWESGNREPKIKSIKKICAYFNLDLNSFVDESIDEFAPAGSTNVCVEHKNNELSRNVIRIAGRDGSYHERVLSDSQLAAVKAMIDQLPDASDDL